MVKNTRPIGARGNEQRFTADDLKDGKTLDSDRYVTLFEVQGDTTTAYGPGNGPRNADHASGWSDFDLQDVNGNAIEGKYRWEVYKDSSKEDLVATSSTFTDGDLRSAVNSARKDKRNIPGEQPVAGNDSYLVFAFRASASSDGAEVSAQNSDYDLGVAYSEYK